LGARPLAAVHVARQAEDKARKVPFRDDVGQFRRVLREFPALDGVSGVATLRKASETATPMVLVPKSSPAIPRARGSAAAKSAMSS
jgi:hypothetical protein